jgi:integrase
MNIRFLPDRAVLDARTNLDSLVAQAKTLPVFGPSVNFDDAMWDLKPVKPMRLSTFKQRTLYFTTHAGATNSGLEGRKPFAKIFGDLIKALVVMSEFAKPTSAANHNLLVLASRSLYEVLKNRGFDPVELVSSDFQAAANAMKTEKNAHGRTNAEATQYRRGQALTIIADGVNRYNVSKVRINFVNPFPRIAFDDTRISEEAKARRANRMASDETIGAIIAASEAVRRSANDADLLLTAVVELLLCAPWRINELLDLALDCVREENAVVAGRAVRRVGIAYNGSKGAPDSVRWTPTPMVEIAERALADIQRITKPARDIAIWMEQHRGRAWLREPWRLADPATVVSTWDVARMLGLYNNSSAQLWADANGVPLFMKNRKMLCRLGDVEKAVLALQPKVAAGDVPLSKRLFLVPKNYFATNKADIWSVITCIVDAQVHRFLCGHPGMRSIFERLDLRDEDGRPHRVKTHSLRHLLNTLAQKGMLSQLDIARWSGRKEIRQNEAYDHTGGVQLGREMRRVLETDAMKGPVVETVARLAPADRETFLKGRFATAHLTSVGACVQDFSLAPCPSHGACASCSEHLVIKGKPEHRAEAERLLEEHQTMLDAARAELADGTYNAATWVAHNAKMVDGLKKILAVHDNTEIADGTAVQI